MIVMGMGIKKFVDLRDTEIPEHFDATLAHAFVTAVDEPSLIAIGNECFVGIGDDREPDMQECCIKAETDILQDGSVFCSVQNGRGSGVGSGRGWYRSGAGVSSGEKSSAAQKTPPARKRIRTIRRKNSLRIKQKTFPKG
jgi:hypothetical protein